MWTKNGVQLGRKISFKMKCDTIPTKNTILFLIPSFVIHVCVILDGIVICIRGGKLQDIFVTEYKFRVNIRYIVKSHR